MGQPDTLHRKALDLKQDLKDLDIKRIIEQNEQDLDLQFFERYGVDLDDFVICDEANEAKIKNLGYKFSGLISLARTVTRTPASRRGVTQHSTGTYWTTMISKPGA